MDSIEYKSKCSKPNVLNRIVISDTLAAVKESLPEIATRLEEILASPPIPKPVGHAGGPESDHFEVHLPGKILEQIVEQMGDLEVGSVGLEGETTPRASFFADLLDTWTKVSDAT